MVPICYDVIYAHLIPFLTTQAVRSLAMSNQWWRSVVGRSCKDLISTTGTTVIDAGLSRLYWTRHIGNGGVFHVYNQLQFLSLSACQDLFDMYKEEVIRNVIPCMYVHVLHLPGNCSNLAHPVGASCLFCCLQRQGN